MDDMQGRVVLITGATKGLGEVTAHAIARTGATVVIAGRNAARTQAVAAEIERRNPGADVAYLVADLSLMDGVRSLADAFRARYERLDVLVNNAGALFTKRELTADGYEKTFALNHLSYFLLTNLLMDRLIASGTPERHSRVVNVSSAAHYGGRFTPDDLNAERSYSPLAAYSASKLHNVLFTYALARRLKEQGVPVTANALHPGVVRTGFGHNNSGVVGRMTSGVLTVMQRIVGITAEEGARTQIYLATSPEVEGVSGKYFDKQKPKRSSQISYNRGDQDQLWQISEQLTGLKLEGAAEQN